MSSCLIKHLTRKIKSFDSSSIILKTEVVNAKVKVVIYELSLEWITFRSALIGAGERRAPFLVIGAVPMIWVKFSIF